jgi:hypothetical protein
MEERVQGHCYEASQLHQLMKRCGLMNEMECTAAQKIGWDSAADPPIGGASKSSGKWKSNGQL